MKTYLTIFILSGLLAVTESRAEPVRVVPRGEENQSITQDTGSPGRTRVMRGGGGRGWIEGHAPHHDPIVKNFGIMRNITRNRRVEVVPNRYYWHSEKGIRYAHYFHRGIHWYGFYNGPRFYWTRYYNDRWWWYDPIFSHWAFWWDGYWWWSAPGGVVYVYVNNAYQPYDSAEVDVPKPELPETPPEGSPPGPSTESTVNSPDGKRMIQIAGTDSEAFLYDTSSGKPVFMKSLAKGAANARFSGDTEGKPLRILVDFQDGHFELFNESGDPVKIE